MASTPPYPPPHHHPSRRKSSDGSDDNDDRIIATATATAAGARAGAAATASSSKMAGKESRRSMELPDRLKHEDDAMDDVTAPGPGRNSKFIMGQSIFSLIRVAGSTADFQSHFDNASSQSESDGDYEGDGAEDDIQEADDENEDQEDQEEQQRPKRQSLGKSISHPSVSTSTTTAMPSPRIAASWSAESSDRKHGRTSSKQRLLRSIHGLKLRPVLEQSLSTGDDLMMSSQILVPPAKTTGETSGIESSPDAPHLSMMLKGEVEMQASEDDDGGGEEEEEEEEETNTIIEDVESSATRLRSHPTRSLSDRLMEIFAFEEAENVIAEYPCWFLQTVLLSGYMYITQKHVCFYAYLPKNSTAVVKSGFLGKRGPRNPHYRRYYFELKGDVLTYYHDPSDIYYPKGHIDLRYGISATIFSDSKHDEQDSIYFTLATSKREYFFRADSKQSAREWVKQLQKVIFRYHNDGSSVKISLPINNILDVEESSVLDFAETLRVRVIDGDETFAVDEYYFSFFGSGKEAMRVLHGMVNGNDPLQNAEVEDDNQPSECGSAPPPGSSALERRSGRFPRLHVHESVHSTLLLPGSANDSRRSSFESPTSSMEMYERSLEASREDSEASKQGRTRRIRSPIRSPTLPAARDSSDTPETESLDHETDSSAAVRSLDDTTNASASQILNRSDIFRAPTSHTARRSVSESAQERYPRASEDTARSPDRSGSPLEGHRTDKLRQKSLASRSSLSASRMEKSTGTLQALPSTLQELIRAGSYPIQRASDLAELIRDGSRRMGSKIATESMGYFEKVHGMWQGDVKHYGPPITGMPIDDDDPEGLENPHDEVDATRFRDHFAFPDSEQLRAAYYASLHRLIPLYGKIYISNNHLCFRSLIVGTRTKIVLPLSKIESATREKGFRWGFCGMVVSIRGHEEIFFDFREPAKRDDCAVTLIVCMEMAKAQAAPDPEKSAAEAAKAELEDLEAARQGEEQRQHADAEVDIPKELITLAGPPIIFDDPKASILSFKPAEPMRITCLTIGSRGDVQPYIALALGLMADGHYVKIATHSEFEPWIRKHGIDFAPVAGNPAELMRLCIEYGTFTIAFLRVASATFRGWLDEVLLTAWSACQDTDLLIESPSTMAGIHIAEALGIPYFRAFTMPWTRTRAYPHAFVVPENKLGGGYNYLTYVLLDNIFWKGIAGQVNRWRRKSLGLGSTSLDKMQQNKIPFLYNFSPSVVPPPLDYPDWIRITGYWFLDEGKDFVPPKPLADFIRKARDDKVKLVYVGFGSIIVEDPNAMTRVIIEAVHKADVRCILAKGWSDRNGKKDDATAVSLPDTIFPIDGAPHDWLFPLMDAVAHHGGCGTTGASLRAGIPTITKPFFGDQYFFGNRVEDLGVGICLKKINSTVLGRALWEATRSERLIARARALGEQIRSEDGVATAIKHLYRDLEYAKSLIKRHDSKVTLEEGFEETWTFVDSASSDTSEVTKSMAEVIDSTTQPISWTPKDKRP